MRQDPKAFFLHNLNKFGPIQDIQNQRANKTGAANWRDNNNNWSRAILQEATELQNHIGWAWWKGDEANINRAFMELVDIQHFWISGILQTRKTDWQDLPEEVSSEISDALTRIEGRTSGKGTINSLIDLLIYIASKDSIFGETLHDRMRALLDMGAVIQELVIALGKTNAELYAWYAGKGSLNLFRYDNGYKSANGGYIKAWVAGGEDNDFLEKLIVDPAFPHDTKSFYDALAKEYVTIKQGGPIKGWDESASKICMEGGPA